MQLTTLRSFYLFLFLFIHCILSGQPVTSSASEIQLSLKKLNALGSVLYLAAHPDDENTQLISYLSNEALFNTAYLSITRGDGGQNLIGPEIQEMLGVIRTQELLQARRIDGGKQFFTRANDFGYSKNHQETFNIWDKQKVLSDVVWVIRNFRPDVIITRFPPDERGRHGHHTASAILAHEAFVAAADPLQFPEQLPYVQPWQARSLLFNTTWWFYGSPDNFNSEGMVSVDVGAYNQLLGKSYTEIAAQSRSMHKSQGFGASGSRGTELEYLENVKGEQLPQDFFQNPDYKWNSIEGGERLFKIFTRAYQEFDPENPAGIVPVLLEGLEALDNFGDPYWKQVKSAQLKQIIQASLGLYLEASTAEISATPGERISIKLEATNRSKVPVTINDIELNAPELEMDHAELENNVRFEQELSMEIPEGQSFSQPYWLRSSGSIGMFEVSDPLMIGRPDNDPAICIPFNLIISGVPITYYVPLVHKSNDPVEGEVVQPLIITPPVTINFNNKVQVFADQTARTFSINLKSGRDSVDGELKILAPDGWSINPEAVSFELGKKGEEQEITFSITPPKESGEGKIKAEATVGGHTFSLERVNIQYDHIPYQVLFPEAAAKVVKLDIIAGGLNVGYIMGAGDDIPNSLRQIGYSVDLLETDDLTVQNLSKYHAVILGIRALNTLDRLSFQMHDLLSYTEQGGTLIVQYNTSHRLVTNNFAPYPLELSRDRVSVEDAPVEFLRPDHQVLNYPNKITMVDFDGWIQERGLYFPASWDDRYQAIITTNDPDEPPKHGGLLVANYGKGHYVYTGLSWFRELPAGVPGAYRIFANLISLGQQEPDN